MSKISAFVGHSFAKEDQGIVERFLKVFDGIKNLGLDFDWDSAEVAEPKELSEKVREKMEGKNLFIGICTNKEFVINPKSLKQSFIPRNYLKAKREEFSPKTSDWIIQEIGFAMGRNMDIILLIQEGLKNPGEFQGNIEKIYFNTNSPEECVTKIIQMIGSLLPKIPQNELIKPTSADQNITKKEIVSGENLYPPQIDWKSFDYNYAMVHWIAENDREKEKRVYEAYLDKENLQENEKISWEANRLYLLESYGIESTLAKLQEMKKIYPSNSDIMYFLGLTYELFEEHGKAGDEFKNAIELAINETDKLDKTCLAAESYSKNGDRIKSIELMNSARDLIQIFEEGEKKFLESLLKILKIENRDSENLGIMERMVDLAPDDFETRFSLALAYGGLNANDLAAHHYKILCKTNQDEAYWNNLAVAQDGLELPGKSISSYKKSELLGGTLASSNLAFRYIKSGFFEDAEIVCKKALDKKEFDKRVAKALANIESKRESEETKEKELLKKTDLKRNFLINFGQACVCNPPSKMAGLWKGPKCHLSLNISGGTFEATGQFEIDENASKLFGLGGFGTRPAKKLVKFNVSYTGVQTGMGITFSLVENKDDQPRRAGLLRGPIPIKGYMVISDDLNEIIVYENALHDEGIFYTLVKIKE